MAGVWLSVVIPTCNGAAYLPAALESLCGQSEQTFEVIAVDDGSTDETLAVLERFSARLPLRVVARRHSGNWVASTNLGMWLAQGRYLGWLHQDDQWAPERVASLHALAGRHPDAALLFHPVQFIDGAGRTVGTWRPPLRRPGRYLPPDGVFERLMVQNFIAASAAVFPAGAWRQVGDADERLWFLADWDFWLRLARHGPVVYHPGLLGSFRLHGRSQTAQRFVATDDLAEQYRIVLARHLDPSGQGLPCGAWVAPVARFAADMTLALSAWSAGRSPDWPRLARAFLRLGPGGWFRFAHHSRIAERLVARLRGGVRAEAAQHP